MIDFKINIVILYYFDYTKKFFTNILSLTR